MYHPKTQHQSSGTVHTLHPIAPHSDLGRWIAAQEWTDFSLEEALENFAWRLRMGSN